MILTCPSCGTRYLADMTALGPEGRVVRCAGCGHTWHQLPPQDAHGEETPLDETTTVDVTPDAVTDIDAEEASPPAGAAVRRGWIAFGTVLCAVIVALVFLREPVVERVPQMALIYDRFGMTGTASGLQILATYFERGERDGEPVLTVYGELVNASTRQVSVPPVRISLRDAAQREVFAWTKQPDAAALSPGGTVRFSTTIANPPVSAQDLEVKIAR